MCYNTEDIKKKKKKTQIEHTEIKTTTSKVRNGLDEINSRLDIAIEYISEFEDTAIKTIPSETEFFLTRKK